ncbi:hypothetical protein HORIV_63060 [Vreelandella olivaria]|uniref:Gamma-glutamyl-gamma-aminobutyrate hydrolase n=1 Tax=Vreelandella olivaria TaxID=390919 RepID=A0ABN5XAH1_9GAMM|nr:hypothetical protein HORIV_63060 [Halomonas olivaria]
MVTDKFLQALYHYGVTPVILPVLVADIASPEQRAEQAVDLLGSLDGLMLTGSYSNVAPNRYGAERAPENTRDDARRDEAALCWVHEALRQALPLFGICRGFQEMNVALGARFTRPYKRYQACWIIVSRPPMTWPAIMHPPIR